MLKSSDFYLSLVDIDTSWKHQRVSTIFHMVNGSFKRGSFLNLSLGFEKSFLKENTNLQLKCPAWLEPHWYSLFIPVMNSMLERQPCETGNVTCSLVLNKMDFMYNIFLKLSGFWLLDWIKTNYHALKWSESVLTFDWLSFLSLGSLDVLY